MNSCKKWFPALQQRLLELFKLSNTNKITLKLCAEKALKLIRFKIFIFLQMLQQENVSHFTTIFILSGSVLWNVGNVSFPFGRQIFDFPTVSISYPMDECKQCLLKTNLRKRRDFVLSNGGNRLGFRLFFCKNVAINLSENETSNKISAHT
jgi:hypothetical protein